MKKLFALYLILLGLTSTLKADDDNPPANYGSITGSVIDATTNEPMPYVNVVVRNDSDSILTGGITDDKGNFVIRQVPEGSSRVEIQFIGYEKITREIDISRARARYDLSTLTLEESTQQLEEVVVRGELSTVTQKIDRKVINVGKDLTSIGTTASDVLNNVQSVSVDPQTGSISLRGNENVKILVDGRPTNVSAAQLMQQIPSSSIKSIELITNPSAKYNPEGMSGIINIVLYKNATLGLNGSLNGGVSRAQYMRYNGALDVNYRQGKINLFANYGGNSGTRVFQGDFFRSDNASHSNLDNLSSRTSHLLKVGADFYLNPKNTLSVYTTQNLYGGVREAYSRIYFEDILTIDNPSENIQGNYTGTYNLNFRRDFEKKGHNLEFEVSHSISGETEDASFEQLLNPLDLTNNYNDEIRNDVYTTLVNVDYTNPITENGKLELGLEARMRGTDNQYVTNRHQFVYDENNQMIPDGNDWFLTDPMGNSSFTYNRNILSAYTNYAQQLGKFSMQLGVRLEQYSVDAVFNQEEISEDYTDNLLTAYPSAFVTYAQSDKNQFQVSYSRRVDRPGIGQVNPIRANWSSPLMTFMGNPELQPQFTNSYELNYQRRLKKGYVSIGTFYRAIHDNIIRYFYEDPYDINKVIATYENAEGENRYGFELAGMYRFTKWWSLNASADLYSQRMTGFALGEFVEVRNLASNVRMNNTFRVTDKLSVQLSGMLRGPGQTIQWKSKSMGMLNTGVSYKVFRQKGTLSLRVSDILGTMRMQFETVNFYPSTGGFTFDVRSVYVGYSHLFGQGKSKARRWKSRDNHELRGSEGF